jgi:predicted RNA binding protein YcfA (HicA-like mRNA interferase family)
MPHLSPISPRKLMRLLEREGFEWVKTKGSHRFFLHADGRTTSVPVHGSVEVGIGLLRQILKDIGWSAEEYQKKLKK